MLIYNRSTIHFFKDSCIIGLEYTRDKIRRKMNDRLLISQDIMYFNDNSLHSSSTFYFTKHVSYIISCKFHNESLNWMKMLRDSSKIIGLSGKNKNKTGRNLGILSQYSFLYFIRPFCPWPLQGRTMSKQTGGNIFLMFCLNEKLNIHGNILFVYFLTSLLEYNCFTIVC